MKNLYTHIIIILCCFLLGCGGSELGGTEFGNPADTGTVVVKTSVGLSSTADSLVDYVVQESADQALSRTYRISFGNSADCSEATFEDIFDETSDTSDCTSPPTDTSLFFDFTASPTIATNSAVTAGEYSCIRVTVCDQIIWTSSGLSECPGTNVSDIVDPRDEASTPTYYYSTSGTFFGSGEGSTDEGAIDNPFLLTESVTVVTSETVTLVLSMTNNDDEDDIVGQYDNVETPVEFQCGLPAPTMTLTTE